MWQRRKCRCKLAESTQSFIGCGLIVAASVLVVNQREQKGGSVTPAGFGSLYSPQLRCCGRTDHSGGKKEELRRGCGPTGSQILRFSSISISVSTEFSSIGKLSGCAEAHMCAGMFGRLGQAGAEPQPDQICHSSLWWHFQMLMKLPRLGAALYFHLEPLNLALTCGCAWVFYFIFQSPKCQTFIVFQQRYMCQLWVNLGKWETSFLLVLRESRPCWCQMVRTKFLYDVFFMEKTKCL